MLWDKVGAGIFKALYFVGKFLGLVALEYDSETELFATSARVTFMSSVLCVFIAIISPIVVRLNTEIYFLSEVDLDDNFTLITGAQFAFGFLTSFIVLLCQLFKREPVCHCGNNFRIIHSRLTGEFDCGNVVTPEIALLIVMKLSITMYEVLINVPYLIEHAERISRAQLIGFLLNLYIAEIAAVFSDIAFVALLILARYFCLMNQQLESLKADMEIDAAGTRACLRMNRRRLRRLIRMYLRVRRTVEAFGRCVEVPILVQTLNSFTNMLANLYALLHFYAVENSFEMKAVVYIVMIFINIYLLIHAAERVRLASSEVRDTLLDMDLGISEYPKQSEWSNDVIVFKIWPVVCEINILGMFPLKNTFVLFLITYASSFIVIILEFQISKTMELNKF